MQESTGLQIIQEYYTPILRLLQKQKNYYPNPSMQYMLSRLPNYPQGDVPVIDVNIKTTSTERIRMIPDSLCQAKHPNMYMYTLDADLSKREKETVTPFILVNLSTTQNIRLRNGTVVAFAEKDETEGEIIQLESIRHNTPTLGTKANATNVRADSCNR